MDKKILSFDLGTGGNKAALYDVQGNCLASTFVPYPTFYPQVGWHEQRPADWWNAVVESTRLLLESSGVDKDEIVCLGISGHSLGAVPVDKDGILLREQTPIWSDIRAQKEVEDFFLTVDQDEWYLTTGNGFPPACYTIFKVIWYRDHEPEMWKKVHKILGTKDYINFRLTGTMSTDYSYASGTGIYEVPCAARDRAGRDIPRRLPRSVQRIRPCGMTLALTFDSNSAHDIRPRRRHIPAATCRGASRHIPITANPGDGLEMLDSQRRESIMRKWRRREYPAAPVGISPGTAPVIARSG